MCLCLFLGVYLCIFQCLCSSTTKKHSVPLLIIRLPFNRTPPTHLDARALSLELPDNLTCGTLHVAQVFSGAACACMREGGREGGRRETPAAGCGPACHEGVFPHCSSTLLPTTKTCMKKSRNECLLQRMALAHISDSAFMSGCIKINKSDNRIVDGQKEKLKKALKFHLRSPVLKFPKSSKGCSDWIPLPFTPFELWPF